MATAEVITHPSFSSAAGIISLLDEDNNQLREHALKQLHNVVDYFWAEIADAVPLIESLAEDDTFPHRQLAAAVASKCFFHLEEYNDALRLALGAGAFFNVNCRSQYAETLIATCIDEYIQLRNADESDGKVTIDSRMEAIVEKMFQRCYADGAYTQALGIAIESKRLDKVKEVFEKSTDLSSLLAYSFDICRSVITNRDFRLQLLEVMVSMYTSLTNPDYSNICQCLQVLDKPTQVVEMLEKLVRATDDEALIAYQVSFDLFENENQRFLLDLHGALPKPPATEGTVTPSPPAGAPADYWARIAKLKQILSGSFCTDLMLSFLYQKSDSDMLLMNHIKTAVENRSSVLHNAAVVAHGYFNAGTTIDSFLRKNLDWMGRASKWAKFTATASLGVIHKGRVKESMTLLRPYLPDGGVSSTPYPQGGALFALGLIHVNQEANSTEQLSYLQNALRNAGTEEVVQHGACLGIGLTAMASHDFQVYEDLKNVMFTDSAVAGEAASIAIGLVLLGAGTGTEQTGAVVAELLAYAHDTKHEKIIRGAVLAIALIMYGREEEADALIEQMTRDKDPVIRFGAMYTIAMAYCGTGNNDAIRRLLHVAVSDVSDDVRRAAVLCLGFLLFRTPEKVPKLVSLLAESFNPHVRYGACLAVGIACAGTAKNEAAQLLEPMLDDAVDYVRQGATIAFAMVMMQESEKHDPKSKVLRDKIYKIIVDKHQTTMTKMGAIIAQGILDAGGRNVVISMKSHTGFTKMSAVVGLVLWTQHWFWYPLMHFLALSFQPTALIGLNKDLLLPKSFSPTCNSKPSLFSYPKHLEEKKEEKKELVKAAVLSTTAKAKARQAKQESKDKSEEKQPDEDAMDIDKEESKEEEKKEKEETTPEPTCFSMSNPSRVTIAQESVVSFDLTQRYVPIVSSRRTGGVILLKDTKPSEPADELMEIELPSSADDTEKDADPPEPFEWTPPSTN